MAQERRLEMTDNQGKKRYVTPKLTHYGAVRDRTQASSGTGDEGYSGMVGMNPGYDMKTK
jgi:hypothetical protein